MAPPRFYPDVSLRDKYKIWNYILIAVAGLYAISIVMTLFSAFNAFNLSSLQSFEVALITFEPVALLLFLLWAASLLVKYDARGYSFLALFSVFKVYGLLSAVGVIGITTIAINLLLTISLLIFALALKHKLFPDMPLLGTTSKKRLS